MDPDKWEFANEGFLRGQKHLLKTIKRRKPPAPPPSQQQTLGPLLEVGQFGLEGEIKRLKHDKQLLMAELVKLRQEQQNTKAHLKAMEERIQGTEQKQQQMMAFLARVMQNPNFLQQLLHENERRKELEEAISKKRRRRIDRAPEHDDVGTSGNQELEMPIKIEALESLQDPNQDDVSDLESMAKELHGAARSSMESSEHLEQKEDKSDGELNDDFWEELLNEGLGDEKGRSDMEARSNEDVNGLAERLGFLNSCGRR